MTLNYIKKDILAKYKLPFLEVTLSVAAYFCLENYKNFRTINSAVDFSMNTNKISVCSGFLKIMES